MFLSFLDIFLQLHRLLVVNALVQFKTVIKTVMRYLLAKHNVRYQSNGCDLHMYNAFENEGFIEPLHSPEYGHVNRTPALP